MDKTNGLGLHRISVHFSYPARKNSFELKRRREIKPIPERLASPKSWISGQTGYPTGYRIFGKTDWPDIQRPANSVSGATLPLSNLELFFHIEKK